MKWYEVNFQTFDTDFLMYTCTNNDDIRDNVYYLGYIKNIFLQYLY